MGKLNVFISCCTCVRSRVFCIFVRIFASLVRAHALISCHCLITLLLCCSHVDANYAQQVGQDQIEKIAEQGQVAPKHPDTMLLGLLDTLPMIAPWTMPMDDSYTPRVSIAH